MKINECCACRNFESGGDGSGECRAAPPVPIIVATNDNSKDETITIWPQVNESDWCGAWEELAGEMDLDEFRKLIHDGELPSDLEAKARAVVEEMAAFIQRSRMSVVPDGHEDDR